MNKKITLSIIGLIVICIIGSAIYFIQRGNQNELKTEELICPEGNAKAWSNCACSYVCMEESLANDPARSDCDNVCL